jgi:hypothetical protein
MFVALVRVALLLPLVAACAGGSGPPAAPHGEPRVGFAGYRGVRVGMTPAEASRAYGEPLVASAPPFGEASECHHLHPEGAIGPASFMVFEGVVVRVEVRRGDVLTERGVGVGSSEDEVRAAYPEAASSPHHYVDGHYLTVTGEDGLAIVFETDGERVTEYRAGRRPEVDWIEGCS